MVAAKRRFANVRLKQSLGIDYKTLLFTLLNLQPQGSHVTNAWTSYYDGAVARWPSLEPVRLQFQHLLSQ